MVGKRNTIVELTEFLKYLGIVVNICKNKARGHKGFFMAKGNVCRIDISKNLSEEEILHSIVHELSHFIHYKYDKKLRSLDFMFESLTDEILEELVAVSVASIPKSEALLLYEQLENAKQILNVPERLRQIKRINSKINRLNRYYNMPTELFARFMEMYFLNNNKVLQIAPVCCKIVDKNINNFAEFSELSSILHN